ncbi:hypothetical protein FOCC_FOCC015666 [Frankliniella occidentalis]|nr:hypothetical protein FOCC_FOCC015666 [Frankliniella occidentalis]
MSDHIFVGEIFKTWKEFENAQELYQKEKNVTFVTKHSHSIKRENKQRAMRDQAPLLHELEHKNIVIWCKFAAKPRPGKGGAHIKVNQATWKIGCEAEMQLIAYENGLEVKKLHDIHTNHDCIEEETDVMPENRQVDPKDRDTINTLLKGKVKPARIKAILNDMNSTRITPRDIANYRAKCQRNERGDRSESQVLQDTLLDILEADSGATIATVKDTDDTVVMLFVQTSEMRLNAEKYGIVIHLDHTYKIDKNGMPLAILMVRDGNGLGRVVGIAYVANEEKVTIASILQAFKDSIGEEIASQVKTFIIDKDMSEAGAIKEVFPNSSIQLCDFHVSKTFNSAAGKEHKKVRDILEDLRFCLEEENFESLCNELIEVASDNFYAYFDKNWRKCPLAWSFRQKKTSPNLGNNTNNILENFNGKVKMVTDLAFVTTIIHERIAVQPLTWMFSGYQ